MHVFAAQKISFRFFSLEKTDNKFSFAICKQEGLVSTQRNKQKVITVVIKVIIM